MITTPSEFDKLAVAGEAVKQWYDEYVNYNTEDGGRNGNIVYDGQIGHFLQVICKGSSNNGKIGVGIYSEGSTTIVCVQYQKKASSMNKTADYIKYPSYIGSESLLTIHEEKKLRDVIASGNAENLFKTCQFYLNKSEKKIDYMKLEAQDEFTKIIENGYSKDEWTTELDRIKTLVTAAKTKTSSQLSELRTDISAILIPQSLAESSFRDLQLTGFFMETMSALGLTILVNGHTRDRAIIANQTINAIIHNNGPGGFGTHYNDGNINWTSFNNTCNNETDKVMAKKCIRVMLGLFGVQSNTSRFYDDAENKFTKSWQRIIQRLKWCFNGDTKGPNAVIEGYNSLKGNGLAMTDGYATDCPIEKTATQDIEPQYDIVKDDLSS